MEDDEQLCDELVGLCCEFMLGVKSGRGIFPELKDFRWQVETRNEHQNHAPEYKKKEDEPDFEFDFEDGDPSRVVEKGSDEDGSSSDDGSGSDASNDEASGSGEPDETPREKKKKKKKTKKMEYDSDEEARMAKEAAAELSKKGEGKRKAAADDEEEDGDSDSELDEDDELRLGGVSGFVSSAADDKAARRRAKDEDSEADELHGEAEKNDKHYALKKGLKEGNIVMDDSEGDDNADRMARDGEAREASMQDEQWVAKKAAEMYKQKYGDEDEEDEAPPEVEAPESVKKVDVSAASAVSAPEALSSLKGLVMKAKKPPGKKKVDPNQAPKPKVDTDADDDRKKETQYDGMDVSEPALLYERLLSKNAARELRLYIKSKLADPKHASMSQAERDACETLSLINVSEFLWVVNTLMDSKDFLNLQKEAAGVYDRCQGNYEKDKIDELLKIRRYWIPEHMKSTRRAGEPVVFSDDVPRGARPVDCAFTRYQIENRDVSKPKDFTRVLTASLPTQYMLENFITDESSDFIVTKEQCDEIVKGNGGQPWKCSFAQVLIKPGDLVRCLCGVPDPMKSPQERADMVQKGVVGGAYQAFGIGRSLRNYMASDLNFPELKGAPFVFFIRMKKAEDIKKEAELKEAEPKAAEVKSPKAKKKIDDSKPAVPEKPVPVPAEPAKQQPASPVKAAPPSPAKAAPEPVAPQPVVAEQKNGSMDVDGEDSDSDVEILPPHRENKQPEPVKEPETAANESVDDELAPPPLPPTPPPSPAKAAKSTPPPSPKSNGSADDGKKRKSDDVEKDDGSDIEAPAATKRPRGIKWAYESVSSRDPPPVDVIRASFTETEVLRRVVSGKGREYTCTAVTAAEVNAICQDTEVFLTDAAVKILNGARAWLLEDMQLGFSGGSSKLPVEEVVFRTIFSSKGAYEDETFTTADLLFSRIAVATALTGGTAVLNRWLRFILCSFVQCNEAMLMRKKGKEDITHRENTPLQSLANDDVDHLNIGELPFGRHLTTRPFTLQFVRCVLAAFVERYVFKMGDMIAEAYTKAGSENPASDSVEATLKIMNVSDNSREWHELHDLNNFVGVLTDYLHEEGQELRGLLENEYETEDARKDAVQKHMYDRFYERTTRPTTERRGVLRNKQLGLVKAWRIMRTKLLADDIATGADAATMYKFASCIFPLQV